MKTKLLLSASITTLLLADTMSVAAGAATFTDKLGNPGSIIVEYIGDKIVDALKQSDDLHMTAADAVRIHPCDLTARFAGCILTKDQFDEMITIIGADNSSPSVANAKTLVRVLDIDSAKTFGLLESIGTELSDEMIVMLAQGAQAEDIIMMADDPISVFDARQVGSFFLTDLVTKEPLTSSIVELHFGTGSATDEDVKVAAE